jgi:hypothetical protein
MAPSGVSPGPEGIPWQRDPSVDGERFWFGAEYLLWWFRNSPLPVPLVTTTANPDLTPTAAFNQLGTSVLLGNQGIDTGTRHGARITAGAWLDNRHTIGLEGNYFFVASHTVTQNVNSPGTPILAIPFFDADAQAESSFVQASPSSMAGGAVLSLSSRLQGAEINALFKTCSIESFRFQVLGGFRYLELTENLNFATSSVGIQDPAVDGSNNGLALNTLDQFNTRNTFYGFQLGARAEYRLGDFSLSATGKLALGESYQVANLIGSATTNFFNAPTGGPFTGVPVQTLPGTGTFVQASNQGTSTRHEFAAVPEVGVNFGYEVVAGLRVFFGYDLLYFSKVLRPGNLIDRSFNAAQTVQSAVAGNPAAPGTFPAIILRGSDFWAQGINLGLEYRY